MASRPTSHHAFHTVFMWHLRAVISSHQWVSYSAHNTYHNGAKSNPKLTGMKIIIVREVMSLLISIIWISLLDKQAHWSHSTYTGSISLASASLCSIFTHPVVLYELSRLGMLTHPSEVPAPGSNGHSAPHQSPSKMCCLVVIVGRLNSGIAGILLHARCWFFLKIQKVVKATVTNKSIQMMEACQECPERQTVKHRAAWPNLQPYDDRDKSREAIKIVILNQKQGNKGPKRFN